MHSTDNREPKRLNRREFLAGAAGAVAIGAGLSCSAGGGGALKTLPRRKLGRTDLNISLLGVGGGSTLSMIPDYPGKLALVDFAFQSGINLFDSSANYGPESEGCYGEALQAHRKEVYFSTKYETEHGPDQIKKDVEQSLKRLRTDYIDIAHMHAIKEPAEVETMLASGALDTLARLKEQGVIRYLGVTSHNHPPALAEALRRFDFDVCMLAANASRVPYLMEFDPESKTSFEDLTLPLANQKGLGVISYKILGQRRLIRKEGGSDGATPQELIRYGLSLPVHGILLGMNTPGQVTDNVELACSYTPMSPEEMRALNERLAPNANRLTLHYLDSGYRDDGAPRAHLA